MIWTSVVLLLASWWSIPGTAPPPPSEGAPPILQPTRYESPSGDYALDVDPSSREGAGPGTYRMTWDGEEVWAKQLPVTLWNAAVTDRGFVGGYAYSAGWRDPRVDGSFHVLILSPTGEVLLNEETKRRASRYFHTPPDPTAAGLFASDYLDRIVVRVAPLSFDGDPTWRAFRLSTGEALENIVPGRPSLSSPKDSAYIWAAESVPGTPLTLAWWKYREFASTVGPAHWSEGAIFTLHDSTGRIVWSLDRQTSYTIPDDREAQEQLIDLVWEHGAILDVAFPGRFSLWLAGDGQRVDYEVVPPHLGSGWTAERGEVENYTPPPKKAPIPPSELELRHLGTVELKPATPTVERPIHDVQGLGFADDGTVEFIRAEEEERVFSYVRLRGDGECAFETTFPPIAPEHEGQLKWFDPGGRFWLAALCAWGPGQATRLFRADTRTGELNEVEEFDGPFIGSFAATGDGGFVAVVTYRTEHTMSSSLARFDSTGAMQWRVDAEDRKSSALPSHAGVAFTKDGRIAVVDTVGMKLQVFDSCGAHVRDVDLTSSWPWEARYPTSAWADRSGNVLVRDEGMLRRTGLDGTFLGTVWPRHPGGKSPTSPGGRLAIAPDGKVWCSDGTAIYGLDRKGVVDRVLGTTPSAEELSKPCSAFIDRRGRVLIEDSRSGALHAFDQSGTSLFVCRPEPGELDRDSIDCLAVDHEGGIYVGSDRHRSPFFLRFDPEGRRIGGLSLGADEVAFDPGRPVHWILADDSLLQQDQKGVRLAQVERRSDRRWLRYVSDFDVLLDGTLVLVDTPGLRVGDSESALAFYDLRGNAQRTIPLPESGIYFRMAASSRWIVVGCFGSDQLLVRVRDGATFRFDPCRGEENRNAWRYGFSPDEEELWGVETGALKLHRYALPG